MHFPAEASGPTGPYRVWATRKNALTNSGAHLEAHRPKRALKISAVRVGIRLKSKSRAPLSVVQFKAQEPAPAPRGGRRTPGKISSEPSKTKKKHVFAGTQLHPRQQEKNGSFPSFSQPSPAATSPGSILIVFVLS